MSVLWVPEDLSLSNEYDRVNAQLSPFLRKIQMSGEAAKRSVENLVKSSCFPLLCRRTTNLIDALLIFGHMQLAIFHTTSLFVSHQWIFGRHVLKLKNMLTVGLTTGF